MGLDDREGRGEGGGGPLGQIPQSDQVSTFRSALSTGTKAVFSNPAPLVPSKAAVCWSADAARLSLIGRLELT